MRQLGEVTRASADKRTGRPIRLNDSKWSVGLLHGSRSMNRYEGGAEIAGEHRQEEADLIRFQTNVYKTKYRRLNRSSEHSFGEPAVLVCTGRTLSEAQSLVICGRRYWRALLCTAC